MQTVTYLGVRAVVADVSPVKMASGGGTGQGTVPLFNNFLET